MVAPKSVAAAFVLAGSVVGAAVAHAELPGRADSTPQPRSRTGLFIAEGRLEEVIVTANRRQESNQRVPIGIASINADGAVKVGVTDAQSLAGLVPGLLFNRQANTSIPFLRGVGTPVGQSGDEPSVALYVDGVYVPAGSASMANFTSIDHIEVAKGPQGTLFGRNATGGVVQVFTRNPTDQPQLDVSVGYGNYDSWSANTYVSGPLTEQLLANFSRRTGRINPTAGVGTPRPGPRRSDRARTERASSSSGLKAIARMLC